MHTLGPLATQWIPYHILHIHKDSQLHIQCKGKVIGCLERRYFGIVLHGSIPTTCVFDSPVQIPGEESIIQFLSVAQNWLLSCMIVLISCSVIQLNSLLNLFPYLSSSTYYLPIPGNPVQVPTPTREPLLYL